MVESALAEVVAWTSCEGVEAVAVHARARRDGIAVPVVVEVEMTFTIGKPR